MVGREQTRVQAGTCDVFLGSLKTCTTAFGARRRLGGTATDRTDRCVLEPTSLRPHPTNRKTPHEQAFSESIRRTDGFTFSQLSEVKFP